MLRRLAIYLFLLVAFRLNGQVNLVPNPSFEIYDTCPNTVDKIKWAPPWFQPNDPQSQTSSSTDYYNSCASSIVGVPSNYFGFQYPRTGNAYIGYSLFSSPTDNAPREYAEVELDSTLTVNRRYCVSFYASLPGNPSGFCMATSAVGVYFSSDTCQYVSNWTILPVQPQLINNPSNVISDTAGWSLVKWIYLSQGTEKFMTFGNFWDGNYNAPNSYQVCNSGVGSYFYMDDVSVVLLPEIFAGNDLSINPGDSIALNGSISETWPGMQFEWLPHTGLSNPYSLFPEVSPTSTTTYTLTVSCSTCDVPCLSDVLDSMTVFVEPVSPPQKNPLHIPSFIHSGQAFVIDSLPAGTKVKFYDMRGRLVFYNENYANDFYPANLDGANYIYEVSLSDGKKYNGKFCVIKN